MRRNNFSITLSPIVKEPLDERAVSQFTGAFGSAPAREYLFAGFGRPKSHAALRIVKFGAVHERIGNAMREVRQGEAIGQQANPPAPLHARQRETNG